MRKYNLLIVEAGFKTHKEFLVKCLLATKKVNLYFANGLSKRLDYDWLSKYSSGGFDFSYTENNLLENTVDFQKRNRVKFDGVLTWVDTSVHFVNELQHDLNLPVISQLRGKQLRNKGLVRRTLAKAKVDTTFYKILKSSDDLEKIDKGSLKYPMILKPTEMMASLGVTKIKSFEDLKENLDKVLAVDFKEEDLRELYGDIASEAILEEFLDGDGYSVESIVKNGATQIIGIHSKYTKNLFDRGNVLNNKIDKSLNLKIIQLVNNCHCALEIENSMTHIELRVVGGEPRIIEINSRLGGDYIPNLLHKNAGRDIGLLLLAASTEFNYLRKFSAPKRKYAYSFTSNSSGRLVGYPKNKLVNCIQNKQYYSTNDIVLKNIETEPVFLGHAIFNEPRKLKLFEDVHTVQKPMFHGHNHLGREIIVFQANKNDLNNIANIEKESWSCKQAAPLSVIKKRLSKNPERFFVAFDVKTRNAVGLVYWVPVTKGELDGSAKWDYFSTDKILNRRDIEYHYRYIVSISIKPDAPKGTDTLLLQALKNKAADTGILEFRYGSGVTGF